MKASSKTYNYVFYCTYQNDENVEANNPVQIKYSEMNQLVDRVGANDENFIGFIDNDETTLQFYVNKLNEIYVEIPDPEKKGSYGKQINQATMKAIVNDLETPYINYKDKLNLSFLLW